ncbi:MAG: hypothetical protein ACI9MB_000921, partial [Verrucomicrobiales bacterium]
TLADAEAGIANALPPDAIERQPLCSHDPCPPMT